MRFFTPELYLRYNARDDAEADQADEQWEARLRAYRTYLSEHAGEMNERVRELAEKLVLHDSELLSIQEDIPEPHMAPPFSPHPVAIISVRNEGIVTNLFYMLWSGLEQSRPESDWPFSKQRTHWLYDEIEVERWPRYRHRILWSDGRVLTVPFFDVIVQSFSTRNPEPAVIAKMRS